MSRYDKPTKAETFREYAKAQRELAQEKPDAAVSFRQNAAEWDRLARRAEREGR